MKHLRLFVIWVVVLGLLSPQTAFAQRSSPGCADQRGSDCQEDAGAGFLSAQASTNMKLVFNKTLKGGYVAHGVGMRNTGSGTITVNDVPADAKVVKAYLLWAIIGPAKMTGFAYNKGQINGSAITGTQVATGLNPRAAVDGYGMPPVYTFRADVTSRVAKTGNGTYALTGFASGITNGSDPKNGVYTAPLIDGATLIIIYSHPSAPLRKIIVYNGAATTGRGKPQNLHMTAAGINTGDLTGLSQTTFIVAEGQNFADDQGALFFHKDLGLHWNGESVLNGKGETFEDGNLWDTQTVDLTYLIDPPETEFQFTLSSDHDGVTWVGQVVSYASGNQDTDGDQLKDAWELFGITREISPDITEFLDLPGFGADPLHKDLFVEADYMTGHDHLMAVNYLEDLVTTFANAPVSNPDGTTGIHLRIDTGGAAYGQPAGTYQEFNLGEGNAIPEDAQLGAVTATGDYDWSEFQAIKNVHFDNIRLGVFHYMIFAHDLPGSLSDTSGISRNGSPDSRFIKGASDFIVSLGAWDEMGIQPEREAVFLHELGHNLGLRHGGSDVLENKPNYLSVMNKRYMVDGIYRDDVRYFDFARIAPALAETGLNETTGLGPLAAGYGLSWYCPAFGRSWQSDVPAPVDWNCDDVVGGTVKADINGDGKFTALKSQNDWASITFQGLVQPILTLTKPIGCLTQAEVNSLRVGGLQPAP